MVGRVWNECVAVLTMLYKKNDAVTSVGSDFLSDRALHLARYTGHPWIPSWIRLGYGQI